jgi:hypothetical protein
VVREVFLEGNAPNAVDMLYRVYQINRETGRLATVFTPPTLIEEKTFMVVPPQASEWANMVGLPRPPEDYDAIQPSTASPEVQIKTPLAFDFVAGRVVVRGSAAGEGFGFYQLQVGAGLNPQNWLQIGSDGNDQVIDGVLGEWDTQGQEGLYALRLLVVRQDQRIEVDTIQVTVDNTPPVVSIPYPQPDQVFAYTKDWSILFQANVIDSMDVAMVVWVLNGRTVGESLQAPYAFNWQTLPGTHTLEVRAFDQAGNEGRSEPVRFQVDQ